MILCFFTLFLTISLSVFNIFLPLCCLSLVFTYLWSVSYSVSVSVSFFFLSPFLFLWGWKPSLFYFFFRGRWIFQFCIFSLFMCSLFFFFFPGPFDVSVDSLSFRLDELTDADARVLACTCAHTHTPRLHTHTLTLCLFILETRGIRMQACILVCLSVFSMRCSTHITAHTILKYSTYMKRTFA